MLRVRVLGELLLDDDGDALPLPSRRPARALLGWLALHPGMHARSTVAGLLWPNVRDESARISLRSSLTALRSALGPRASDWLRASRSEVGLRGVWVDVVEFDRLLSSGSAAEAVELCRGDLLSGLDDDWVLAARDAHRARHGEALAALASAAAAAGDGAGAIALARRRAALDPFDEGAVGELMRMLAGGGDRAGALSAYQRLSDRLRRELGVPPSPALRALASGLRDGSAGPAPTVPPGPIPRALPQRVTAAVARGALLGRAEELAALHRTWNEVGDRTGRAIALVTGEPGIGKTRLVSEFASQLHAEGAAVLYGVTREEALTPYEPIVDCLHEPVALPPEETHVGSIADGRLRLFEAFGARLDAAGRGLPVVLIAEDLHWAETPTVRLLVHLATRPTGTVRLIVLTYRDTEVGENHALTGGLASLHRALAVGRVTLGGIGSAAVAAMIERASGERDASEAALAIAERTGGNPFFIEQLVGDRALPSGAGRAPLGVEHVVAARVAALGPEASPLLAVAALAGDEFELRVVAAVARRAVDQTLDVLDAAVKARLVCELAGEPGRYAFVHAIVRDTLVAGLTAARRAHIHDGIAAQLAERAVGEADRYLAAAAHHALEAAAGHGDLDRAVTLAERAADRAGSVLAHEDAATLLSRALTVLERRGAPVARRAELQARVALAHGGPGVTILGVDRALVAEIEAALDALGDDHPALRAQLLARLAIERAYEHSAAGSESASAAALRIASRLDDPVALASALNARHVALWGPDHSQRRKELADEMLELAERAGDPGLALQARNWRIVDLMELGEGRAVHAELDAYAALAAEQRLPAYSWYVPMWRATIALLEGRIADGVELSRRARELGRRAGDRNAEVFFTEHVFLRHLVEDRIADIDLPNSEVAETVSERAERGPAWRAYKFTFAWLHAARGETALARRAFDAALADGVATVPRDVNWLDGLNAAAHAAITLGELERCRELRSLLEPYADRIIINARGALHIGSVAYALGCLADACGDSAAAADLFTEAARRDELAMAPAWVRRDTLRRR